MKLFALLNIELINKFKKGGEMEKYFTKQNWYKPQHIDIIKFLTQIELANIELIKKVEKER